MIKIINWKKLVPVLLVFIAIAVFNVIFLDNLVKWGLEKGLTAAAGAKANIGKLDLRLRDFSLNIYKIQVANKNDVWKNLVDIGRIRTAFSGNQLKYSRFIIDELTVEELQFGTKRKYSGEIKKIFKPAKKPGFDLSSLGKSLNLDTTKIEKSFTVGELESAKATERIKQENAIKYAAAEKKVNALDVSAKLKEIDFSVLQGGTEITSLEELEAKLNAVNKIFGQLDQVQQDFETNKTGAQKDLQAIQDNIKTLNDLKQKDLEKIYGKLNIKNYDLAELGKSLLGPKINGYIDNATYWLAISKKYLPPKQPKKAKVKKKDRIKGMDIIFSKQYPKFMIRKILLSGTNSVGELNEASYRGEITNITTEQDMLGAPLLLAINGKFKNNPRSELSIKGTIDHRNETAQDNINFVVSGYKLAGEKLWDENSIPLAIKTGTGTFKGEIALNDDQISGTIKFIATDLVFTKTTSASGTATLVADAISKTNQLVMEINLSGSVDAPNLSIKTNVDSLINQQINALVGDQLNKAKQQVEAEYAKQAGNAQAELQATAAKQQQAMNDILAKQQAVLDAKKAEVDDLKAKIDQQIEDLKNEEVNKLKEEAGSALKNLLKQ